MNHRDSIYLTSWCGGETGNKTCNYSCKLCLIFSKKATLIKADEKTLKLTYQVVAPNPTKAEGKK